MAERLLAGDRLYSGVYDNKDPLFYYLVAAERAVGSWAELLAEVGFVGIAAAAYFITRNAASRWMALAMSLVAVPIIVAGGFYVPGSTELPG